MHGVIGVKRKPPDESTLLAHAYALGRHSCLQAEIATEDAQAGWHVLVTMPGQERIAAAHLTARRFGVYVAEMQAVDNRRGKEAMFPGYVFVFVWGIDQHWQKILGCPGITRILAPISWQDIDRIRAIENEHCPLPLVRAKLPRGYRRNRKREDYARTTDQVVSVRSWSAFQDGIAGLDGEGRNQLLRKALGL